jgi:acyl-CoA thioesterase I
MILTRGDDESMRSSRPSLRRVIRKRFVSLLWPISLALVGCKALPPEPTMPDSHAAAPVDTPSTGSTADRETYLTDFAREAGKKWPHNRMLTVVCFGHSVPGGYFQGGRVQTMDAYPHLLHQQLSDRYPTAVVRVIVSAIGGENAVRAQSRFEADVLALRPDVLLIDYALNDRAVGLDPTRAAWTSFIERARQQGIAVILLTPTADSTAKLADPADPLNQHAEQIRELARTYHTGLVDSLALYKSEAARGVPLNDLLSQNNHPNRRGHELVASEIARWFPAPIVE